MLSRSFRWSLSIAAGIALSALAACGGDNHGATPDAAPGAPDAMPDANVDAPVVTITAPAAVVTGSRAVTVTGTLADPESITGVTVAVGGAAPVAATFDQTSFSLAITLGDDDNSIVVTATNALGHTGAATLVARYPYVEVTDFEPASLILGQPNAGSLAVVANSASTITEPYGVVDDAGGTLWIPDIDDNRILAFRGFPATTDQAADFALGQASTRATTAGAGATKLDRPSTARVAGGKLFVADRGNARVLIWNAVPANGTTPADIVVGQTSMSGNAGACAQAGMARPDDLFVVGGKLIVSDAGNHRILIWNTIPTANGAPADLVLGQGDFTHCAFDDDDQDGKTDTASARTMYEPAGLWSDGTRLAVADYRNNRVLIWSAFPTASFTAADLVLGQPDGATVTAGTGDDGLSHPRFLDSNGNQLAVGEEANNRVLIWDAFPTANAGADHVLGQSDFTHVTANDDGQIGKSGTPTARTMSEVRGVRFVRDGIAVGDAGNNRELFFGATPCAIDQGLYEYPAGSGTCIADPCTSSACTNLRACDHSTGAAVCSCPAGVGGSDCDVCAVYVDAAAGGTGDGSTWANAAPTVGAGLIDAKTLTISLPTSVPSCEAWVKAGTYHVWSSSTNDTITTQAFASLVGGFAGDETEKSMRHGGATILDGTDGGTNHVQHVITASTTGTIDGVTVQGGAATGANAMGGGVYVTAGATVTLTGVTVQDNTSAVSGGGVGVASGALVASSCAFTGNVAGSHGGAIYGSAVVTGGTFTGNQAGTTINDSGGAFFGSGSITGATFVGNTTTGNGGAIDGNNPSSTLVVKDVTVAWGSAVNGGGIFFEGAQGSIDGAIVFGNVAQSSAGGIFIRNAVPVTRSTITGNVALGAEGGGIYQGNSPWVDTIVYGNAQPGADVNSAAVLTYSDVNGVTGTGDLDVDPMFANAPARWDAVASAGAAGDTITVAGLGAIATGDVLELGGDGVARTVTAVTGTQVTFTPALAAPAAAFTAIADWGTGTNLVPDFHLGAGSACVGASSTGGDIGAL